MAIRSRRALGSGLAAVTLIACAVIGLADPHDLVGSAGWSAVVGAVLYGLGGAVRRVLAVSLGIGEQILAGMMVWVGGAGVLLAAGVCSRVPVLCFAMIGFVLALRELYAFARAPVEARPRTDEDRAYLVFGVVLIGLLLVNLLGMISNRANPYDDQVSYVGLVKRLLDCGDLIEPYSFRRLSAYGGQTTLQALAAVRGDVATIDMLDRGIFQIVGVLITLDLTRRRRLHLAIVIVMIGFLLSLWDMALNSAAIWTGFTCFLGAYSFASREDVPPRTALLLASGACAVACTLRQNYLLPAGLFTLTILLFHLQTTARASSWAKAWRAERRTVLLALAVAAVIVLPYMVAALRACGTFLYPFLGGTANPATPLRPTGGTIYDELAFFINVLFNTDPIRVWWLFAPLMLIVRDTRARRPWYALAIACGIGFVALVHSFMLSDNWNLWRYAFAYMSPLALVFLIEVTSKLPLVERETPAPIRVSPAITLLALLAVLVQFVYARGFQISRVTYGVQNMRAGASMGSEKYDPRVDEIPTMQGTIPEGAAIATMLDDPWVLDYARNRIVNLDLVGFAAPAPGLPSFTDPEHWRSYFASQGIRYLMFTEGTYSTWLYRRGGWVWRLFADDELYKFIAAHTIDALDAFDALAESSRVLFHAEGLVALDLGDGVKPEADRGPPEAVRMDEFIRRVAETELHNKAWQLSSRRDVVFRPDGLGPSMVMPIPGVEPYLAGFMGKLVGTLEDAPKRWLSDRTLVRVRGDGKHHIHAKLWVRTTRLQTNPTGALYVSGTRIVKALPDREGNIVLDADATCDGWCDLYITLSTISEWWVGADTLKTAALLELDWTPAR